MIKYRGEVILKADERIDDLERNGYGIIQRRDGFCFGMDAVLLSGFARVRSGGIAVDLGTGTGIIPILLEAKTGGAQFYGLEIQPDVADMAARSVRLNALEDKVHIIRGDIKKIADGSGFKTGGGNAASSEGRAAAAASALAAENAAVCQDCAEAETECQETAELLASLRGRVDTVTSNPPYMKAGSGIKNPDDIKQISRHEVKCCLGDVCRAAAALLKCGGHFYMVHRPLRLPEIISELKAAGLEPKRIKPVYPYIDKEANMILIDAVKGAAPECRFEKPIIVYREPGVYSSEIYDIYGY